MAAADDLAAIYNGMDIVKEYPLDSHSFSVAQIWGRGGKPEIIALKGAPEEVFRLCRLPSEQQRRLQEIADDAADDGLRVLAIAKAAAKNIEPSRDSYQYELLGLVGLSDPIRTEAKDAVTLARRAGIKVIMLTGDHTETARRIGREIGLNAEQVVTGQEFLSMSEGQQRELVKTTEIGRAHV